MFADDWVRNGGAVDKCDDEVQRVSFATISDSDGFFSGVSALRRFHRTGLGRRRSACGVAVEG